MSYTVVVVRALELTSMSRVRNVSRAPIKMCRLRLLRLTVVDEKERSMVRSDASRVPLVPLLCYYSGLGGWWIGGKGGYLRGSIPPWQRPSHAHVACAVCPQLLSCPSTARYVRAIALVRSAAPPARTGLSQRRTQPALPCSALHTCMAFVPRYSFWPPLFLLTPFKFWNGSHEKIFLLSPTFEKSWNCI